MDGTKWSNIPQDKALTAHLLKSGVRIPPGHGYLSDVSVVCCQVEVSAMS